MHKPTHSTLLLALLLANSGQTQGLSSTSPDALPPMVNHSGTPDAHFFWADVDGDGLQDAFVIAADGQARLLRQRPDGLLEDESVLRGLEELPSVRFGLWFDLDLDGDADLFLAHTAAPARMFVNDGNVFRALGPGTGLEDLGPVRFAEALDLDGDGYIDLHVHTALEDRVLRNLGAERFAPVVIQMPTPGAAPAQPQSSSQRPSVLSGRPEETDGQVPDNESSKPSRGDESPPRALWSKDSSGGRSTGDLERPFGRASTGSVTGLGSAENAGPPCAFSIDDFGNGGCLMASSTPTLGMLYPLTSTLFVSDQERVGINTTSPSAALDVIIPSTSAINAIRAQGGNGPTNGYLGALGTDGFDGIASAKWAGLEIGVAGISTGGSSTDNYGVIGHSNHVGVRGEITASSATFGELAVSSGIGLRAGGSLLAGEFLGDVDMRGGTLRLEDTGVDTVVLDPKTGTGGSLALLDDSGNALVDLTAGTAGFGSLSLGGAASTGVEVLGGDTFFGGRVSVANKDGDTNGIFSGGGSSSGASLTLSNELGQTGVSLTGDTGGSGSITMKTFPSVVTSLSIRGKDTLGTGSEIVMRANTGQVTIDLDADSNGGSLQLREADGSTSCDFVGTIYSFHDANGSTTWSVNRTTGTESAVVETPSYGELEVYGMRTTECWVEDFGSGRIVNGIGHVRLDDRFLETVSIDAGRPLKVFVTLGGPNGGHWIQKDRASFTVHLGDDAANMSFDWRVVAKRRGTEALRLERHADAVAQEALLLDPEPVDEAADSTPSAASWTPILRRPAVAQRSAQQANAEVSPETLPHGSDG